MIDLGVLDMAGQVQFKERANDRYDIGCEMVAFSNSRGGRLVIGINDKSGEINALSYMNLHGIRACAGSGVRRALEYDHDAFFLNGVSDKEITHAANEFVINIPRKRL